MSHVPLDVEVILAEITHYLANGYYYNAREKIKQAEQLLRAAQDKAAKEDAAKLEALKKDLEDKKKQFQQRQTPFLVIDRAPSRGPTPQEQRDAANELNKLGQSLLDDKLNTELGKLAQALEDATALLSRRRLQKGFNPASMALAEPIREEAQRMSQGIKTGQIQLDDSAQPRRALATRIVNLAAHLQQQCHPQHGITEEERRFWQRTIDELRDELNTNPNAHHQRAIDSIQDRLGNAKSVHATRCYTSEHVQRVYHNYPVQGMVGVQPFITSNNIACNETKDELIMPAIQNLTPADEYLAAIECLQQMAENTYFFVETLNVRCHSIALMTVLARYAKEHGIPIGEFQYTGQVALTADQQGALKTLQAGELPPTPLEYEQAVNSVQGHVDKQFVKAALAPSILSGKACPEAWQTSSYAQKIHQKYHHIPQAFFNKHIAYPLPKQHSHGTPPHRTIPQHSLSPP